VVSAHFGQLAFEQSVLEDLAVAMFAEADSQASTDASQDAKNALLVLSF
jgi:hypothetical protein